MKKNYKPAVPAFILIAFFSFHLEGAVEHAETIPAPGNPCAGGVLKAGVELFGQFMETCDGLDYSLVVPAGQKIRVEISGKEIAPTLEIFGPGTSRNKAGHKSAGKGERAIVEFTARKAGEYFIIASRAERNTSAAFRLSVACLDKCELRTTRYPVILVHGFSGFKDIGPLEYFYKVGDTLAPMGYDIHTAVLTPYNSTENIRGPELKKYIDEVMKKTHAKKVNIVAHSQGGIDSRFVVSHYGYGDRVGVLNMIASPHHGTPLADIALESWGLKKVMDVMFMIFGIAIRDQKSDQDLKAALGTLSVKHMDGEFNVKNPDDPRVKYKSWSGKSCQKISGSCKNPVNMCLTVPYEMIFRYGSGNIENDGIVPTASAVWSGFQGNIDADHFGEVGQLAGMTGNFDHIAFYRGIFESMAAEGY